MDRKAIFITGGASGIGRAIAQRFAKGGWFVGIGDVDEAGMTETEHLIANGFTFSHKFDVRDREALAASINGLGQLDVLVNCAGLAIRAATHAASTPRRTAGTASRFRRPLFQTHVNSMALRKPCYPEPVSARRQSLLAPAGPEEALGYEVEVVEARDRVGGRLWTLDHVPGSPEGGGNVIGANYGRVIHTAHILKVPLRAPPRALPSDYAIGGRRIHRQDWATSS